MRKEFQMNISATVCEFNPYHNGHQYLAEYAKKQGADYFIGIMSGNVVQRGEFAIADKFTRAKAAVSSGMDMIIELPCIYSLASAERFAYGAVKTLDMCNCIDKLYFGAECADVEVLRNTAGAVSSVGVNDRIKELSASGYSHPRALHTAVTELFGDRYDEILTKPNNTLAVEYLRTIGLLKSRIEPIAVQRIGTCHDSPETYGKYSSASFARECILTNKDDYHRFVPKQSADILDESIRAGECPASIKHNERGFLQALRRLSPIEWSNIPYVSEGLENRLYRAVRECNSLDEITDRIKCKRYTFARISRILMCAYSGITKESANLDPQYIRVLAMNKRGTDILRTMNKNAYLQVIVSPARDISILSEDGKKMFELECKVSDMYTLFTPSVTICGKDYTNKVLI